MNGTPPLLFAGLIHLSVAILATVALLRMTERLTVSALVKAQNMTRYLRYLRILWTVCCGIVCALLIVLWVRSYYGEVTISYHFTGTYAVALASQRGVLALGEIDLQTASEVQEIFGSSRFSIEGDKVENFPPDSPRWDIGVDNTAHPTRFVVTPHWFLALLSATLAAVPWMRWRFTLRTLLLATTLVAVVLGAIVYAVR